MAYGDYTKTWPHWQEMVDAFMENGVALRQASRFATELCRRGVQSVDAIKEKKMSEVHGCGVGPKMVEACIELGMVDDRRPDPLSLKGMVNAYKELVGEMLCRMNDGNLPEASRYRAMAGAVSKGDANWRSAEGGDDAAMYDEAASDAADITSQFQFCELPLVCNELGERYDLSYEYCFYRLAAAVTQEVADILVENDVYGESGE